MDEGSGKNEKIRDVGQDLGWKEVPSNQVIMSVWISSNEQFLVALWNLSVSHGFQAMSMEQMNLPDGGNLAIYSQSPFSSLPLFKALLS